MPRTVLIVDDERDVNDILASLVKARDFEAVQRFEGATVIDDVRTLQPDLVLLDLRSTSTSAASCRTSARPTTCSPTCSTTRP